MHPNEVIIEDEQLQENNLDNPEPILEIDLEAEAEVEKSMKIRKIILTAIGVFFVILNLSSTVLSFIDLEAINCNRNGCSNEIIE